MKDFSELAVDLAYSSVLFDSEELAEEVRNLEVEVDAMQSRFEAWTLRAAADAPDPVALLGLIQLGSSTERISDTAIEISEGVLRDIDVHPVVQMAVQESDEIITRVVVETGSELDGTAVTAGVPRRRVDDVGDRHPQTQRWVAAGRGRRRRVTRRGRAHLERDADGRGGLPRTRVRVASIHFRRDGSLLPSVL